MKLSLLTAAIAVLAIILAPIAHAATTTPAPITHLIAPAPIDHSIVEPAELCADQAACAQTVEVQVPAMQFAPQSFSVTQTVPVTRHFQTMTYEVAQPACAQTANCAQTQNVGCFQATNSCAQAADFGCAQAANGCAQQSRQRQFSFGCLIEGLQAYANCASSARQARRARKQQARAMRWGL